MSPGIDNSPETLVLELYNDGMSATASFLRYLTGFLLFISASLGVTYVVNVYAGKKDAIQAAAAAKAAMLRQAQLPANASLDPQ